MELNVFERLKILTKNSQYPSDFICESCGQFHPIIYGFDRPFYICDGADGTKYFLNDEDLIVWTTNRGNLLIFLSNKLGLEKPVAIDKTTWYFGELKLNKVSVSIFFTNSSAETFNRSKVDNVAVCVNKLVFNISKGMKSLNDKASGLLFLDLANYLSVKSGQLSFNKSMLSRVSKIFYRQVIFNSSGDLFVLGEKILNIATNTRPFNFIRYLWEHFDQTCTGESIYVACVSGGDEDSTDYTAESFCYQMVKQIRDACHTQEASALLSKILSQPSKKHYRLTNPF